MKQTVNNKGMKVPGMYDTDTDTDTQEICSASSTSKKDGCLSRRSKRRQRRANRRRRRG